MSLDLTPNQRKIIAAGLTTLAAAVIVSGVIALLVFMVRFFAVFDNVFLPLAVAGVIALVVEPWYEWLRFKARLPVPLAMGALFLSIGVPLLGALLLFGGLIVTQVSNLLEQVPGWIHDLTTWLQEHRPAISRVLNEHPVGIRLREALERPDGPLASLFEKSLGVAASAGYGAISAACGGRSAKVAPPAGPAATARPFSRRAASFQSTGRRALGNGARRCTVRHSSVSVAALAKWSLTLAAMAGR